MLERFVAKGWSACRLNTSVERAESFCGWMFEEQFRLKWIFFAESTDNIAYELMDPKKTWVEAENV